MTRRRHLKFPPSVFSVFVGVTVVVVVVWWWWWW
jgi:hypothetical protein